MRPKALRKRDEVVGAEDRRESEAEGVPLTDTYDRRCGPKSKSREVTRTKG